MTLGDRPDPACRHILEANGLGEDAKVESIQHLELVMDRKVGLYAFAAFKSVKSLYLVNQKIDSLLAFEEFGGLPSLERLFLNENRLTSLKGVSSCEALRELHAPFNQIASLGSCIIDLRRLRTLNVAHNKLPTFSGLPSSLTTLNIACNQITDEAVVSLPYRLSRNTRNLNLSGNAISSISSVTRLLAFSTHLAELNLQDPDFGACPVCMHSSYRPFALSLAAASLLVLDRQTVLSEERDEAARLFLLKDRFYLAREVSIDVAFHRALADAANVPASAGANVVWLTRSRDSLLRSLRREFEAAGTLSSAPRFSPVSAVQKLLLDGVDASVQLLRSLSPDIVRLKIVIRNLYKTSGKNKQNPYTLMFAVNGRPGLYTNNLLLADPRWLHACTPLQTGTRAVGGQAAICKVETSAVASQEAGQLALLDFLDSDGKITGLAPGNAKRIAEDARVLVLRAKDDAAERWRIDFDLVLSKEDRPGERVAWRLDSDETAWPARYVEDVAVVRTAEPADDQTKSVHYFRAPRFSNRGVFQASLQRFTGLAWNKEECRVPEGQEETAETAELVGGGFASYVFTKFANLRVLALVQCGIASLSEEVRLPASLEQLSVSGNQLHVLTGLGHLPQLVRLDASDNRIHRIHAQSLPPQIQCLRLEKNRLSDEALESLAGAATLRDLYLALNAVKEKRSLLQLKSLAHLEILDLTDNACTEEESYKDYVIFHLRSLRMLDGSSVLVADHRGATERIGGSVTLEFLEDRVGANKLHLASVVTLDLKSCRLRYVGSVINRFHFPALVELLLDGNQLTSVKGIGSLPLLARLSLNNNRLETLHPDAAGCLDEATTLSVLELSGNKLTSLAELPLFCDLSRLRVLHCVGNELLAVEGLANCARLKELNVERNKIRTLDPLSLEGVSGALRTLHIADNALKTLAPLRSLVKLNKLGVASNRVSDIAEIEALAALAPALRDLNLTQNPLSRRHMYRLSIIKTLPFLDVLDDKEVSADERVRVEQIAGNSMQGQARLPIHNAASSNLLPALPRRYLNYSSFVTTAG